MKRYITGLALVAVSYVAIGGTKGLETAYADGLAAIESFDGRQDRFERALACYERKPSRNVEIPPTNAIEQLARREFHVSLYTPEGQAFAAELAKRNPGMVRWPGT